LFTLDKLVYKIVKHLQHMHQDDLAVKLVELHRYEAARTRPLLDSVYAVNVTMLLRDENTFRFETRPDDCLTVQLMYPNWSVDLPGGLPTACPLPFNFPMLSCTPL
jgi:paired amphipathic helix protein Sin3a